MMKNNINIISVKLLIASYVLYSIDFFMTKNPYTAYHGGQALFDVVDRSTTFKFNTAYILIITLVFALIFVIIKNNYKIILCKEMIFIVIIIVSSIMNGSFEISASSTIYNIISILVTMLLAQYENRKSEISDLSINKLRSLWKITIFLLIFGAIIAIWRPYVYGYFQLAFSRSTRGDLTFWTLLGLNIWTNVISIVLLQYTSKIKYLLPILILMFIQFGFSNRAALITLVIPFSIYLISNKKKNSKIIIIIFVLFLFIAGNSIIYNFFFFGKGNAIDTVLTGRLALWEFYLNSFLQHPFFGAGVNLSTSSLYTGYALSEIGVLKWFGEYGIFAGLFLVFLMIKAFIYALKIIFKFSNNINSICIFDLMMSYFYVGTFIMMLVEAYSRILTFTDFFVWFSMFYLLAKKRFV